MRSRCTPPERYPVTLDQLIFDREVEVGEGTQEPRHELLPRTDAAEWLGDAGDVDDAVRRKHNLR